jgi:light-regulated signal transduction histidine kinase (bacteriophytochrome)
VKNGLFLGAFEIYYDITGKKQNLDRLLLTSFVIVIVLALSVLTLSAMNVVKEKRRLLERERAEDKRKKAEEMLADRTVQLERRNRELVALNADLDEFTHMASHDLQEPLRTLTAFSDLLRKDLGQSLPEPAAQDLRLITDAAKRMQTLIHDLLALSRAGRVAKKREKVSLNECAERALGTLAIRVKETGVQVMREELRDVWGDSTLLTELYQNLIGNALKFSGDQRPIIQLTFEERNGDQVFGVKDNGIGLDPKYAQEIFKPFRRLHGRAEYEGSGIGLAICRKIVERHGGKIWVESEPGKGAHFRFTLSDRRRQ